MGLHERIGRFDVWLLRLKLNGYAIVHPLWKSRMERSHRLSYLYSTALKSRAAKPLIHAAVEALFVIAAGCS